MNLRDHLIVDESELERGELVAAFPYFTIRRNPLVDFVILPSRVNRYDWKWCNDAMIFCYLDDAIAKYDVLKLECYLDENDILILGRTSDYVRIPLSLVQRFLTIMKLHENIVDLIQAPV
jgi:hypothetical protein